MRADCSGGEFEFRLLVGDVHRIFGVRRLLGKLGQVLERQLDGGGDEGGVFQRPGVGFLHLDVLAHEGGGEEQAG